MVYAADRGGSSTAPALELRGVSKSYPGVRAVDDVSLAFAPGEVHALVGENGAGKSTLIKIMAGAVTPESGEIRVAGRTVRIADTQQALQLRLGFVHQELNLVPFFDGAENIFLGRPYPRTRFGIVDWAALHRQAAEVLGLLGAAVPVDVPAGRLAPAQQTLLSIARAVVSEPRVLVLDEPTASLAGRETERLFEVIRTLRERGVAVIYVSHRLQEVLDIADSVTVLRNGRLVRSQAALGVSQRDLIEQMTGRASTADHSPPTTARGAPLLEVDGLGTHRLRDITFSVRQGEIVGLAGLAGAGRSEVLRALYGADQARSGAIRLRGRRVMPRSPRAALRAGIALVPEERRAQALILGRPIFENVTLSRLRQASRGGILLHRGRELALARGLGERLRLRARRLTQPVGELSGGNQQKVVFARCLLGNPRVLLLDEPTRGVDVGAKEEIYALVRDLAAGGAAVVVASSELQELVGLAHRIVVLHEGRQVGIFDAGTDERELLAACYGSVTR